MESSKKKWCNLTEKITNLTRSTADDNLDNAVGFDNLSTLSSLKKCVDFRQWTPELCVQMLRIPGTYKFSAIKKILQKANREWLLEFLKEDGLGVLLECLERLSNGLTVSGAMSQLQCVACLRAVTNSKVGLRFISQNQQYTSRLATVLVRSTQTVKLQVFELLSALCLFSKDGHDFTLATLEKFKFEHGIRHKFDLVISEMRNATTFRYQAVLLAFINCIILSEQDLKIRNNVRYQFLVIGLQSILNEMKDVDEVELRIQLDAFEAHKEADETELPFISHQQLFEQLMKKVVNTHHLISLHLLLQKLSKIDHNDDKLDRMWEALNEIAVCDLIPTNIIHCTQTQDAYVQTDLKSATVRRRVFRAQSAQVEGPCVQTGGLHKQESCPVGYTEFDSTPKNINKNFCSSCSACKCRNSDKLTTLSDNNSCITNEFSENCSNEKGNSEKCSSSLSAQAPPIPPPLPNSPLVSSLPLPPTPPPLPSHSFSLTSSNSPLVSSAIPSPSPPQPPPPPPPPLPPPLPSATPSSSTLPPPPPPLPLLSASSSLSAPPPPPLPPCLPSHYPVSSSAAPSPSSFSIPPPPPLFSTPPNSILHMDETNFQRNESAFNTLPARKVNTENVKFNSLPPPKAKMKTINWSKVPNHVVGKSLWSSLCTPIVPVDYSTLEELFCQNTTSKPKLKSSSQPKVQLVQLLDSRRSLAVNIFLKQFKGGMEDVVKSLLAGDKINSEKLRGLKKVLPDSSELKQVKSYTGDVEQLGTAERFYLRLSEISNFLLIIDILLQKEECPVIIAELKPKLKQISECCYEIISNDNLKQFFAIILEYGNFLNSGSYAGNAVGFKLNTLPKLMEIRANKPRVTFLHYIVGVVQNKDKSLLSFMDNNKILRSLCRTPLNVLEEEIRDLSKTVNGLYNKLSATSDHDLISKFSEFLKNTIEDVEELEVLLNETKKAAENIAVYFCEDPVKFSLEDCFELLASFYEKVQQVIVENEQQKRIEERNAKLNLDKDTRKKNKKSNTRKQDSEICLVDLLMQDIRKGSFILRRTSDNNMREN